MMISHKKALSFVVALFYYSAACTGIKNNVVSAQEQGQECPTVDTVENFDLIQYISKPWYAHQQATNFYSPIGQRCTRAIYTLKDEPSRWGYTVDVLNTAFEANGDAVEANLCAYQTEDGNGSPTDASKLGVAPCFLFKRAAGPYWVVAYNEDEGHALISVGQPTRSGTDGVGCLTGNNDRNAGLWIFSRTRNRNQTMIDHVRSIASNVGFDISVLNDVSHVGCEDDEDELPEDNIDSTDEPIVSCQDSPTSFQYFTFWERDCEWVNNNLRVGCLMYPEECPMTCGECAVVNDDANDEGNNNINIRIRRKQF